MTVGVDTVAETVVVLEVKGKSNGAGFEDDDLDDTTESPAKPVDPEVEKNDGDVSTRRKLDLDASVVKNAAARIGTSNEHLLGEEKDIPCLGVSSNQRNKLGHAAATSRLRSNVRRCAKNQTVSTA